jgi:hypothetical protein
MPSLRVYTLKRNSTTSRRFSTSTIVRHRETQSRACDELRIPGLEWLGEGSLQYRRQFPERRAITGFECRQQPAIRMFPTVHEIEENERRVIRKSEASP